MTGSLDQDGVGLGMQRQRGYFLLLDFLTDMNAFASPGFCYKALSISVTAPKIA